jgi:hypothetical protein
MVVFMALLLTLLALPTAPATAMPTAPAAATPAPPTAAALLARLPLAFVPNQGQSDPAVAFQAQTAAGSLFFQHDGFLLARGAAPGVRLRFAGASTTSTIHGSERQPGHINHITGDDPQQWHTGLPTYAALHYQHLYPGIDVRYDGAGGVLKSTYTIAPAADPQQLRWRYEGASSHSDATTGDLIITLADGTTLTEQAPIAWQTIGGQRVAVEVAYTLLEAAPAAASAPLVGFHLGTYDPAYPLTIDPALDFSTYLGAGKITIAHAVAVDNAGNVYITGETNAASFPTTVNTFQSEYGGAGNDAFVTKLDANGNDLIYSTLLGGGGWDMGMGIAVDSAGQAYLTGESDSLDFPTNNAMRHEPTGECYRGDLIGRRCPDAFVTMLNADGEELIYSTLLGSDHPDRGNAILVNSGGQAYIVGTTLTDGPENEEDEQSASEGSGDVFVTRLSFEGRNRLFHTRFQGSGDERGNGIALDEGTGNIYITGSTDSDDFPTTPGSYHPGRADVDANPNRDGDAFVIKLNDEGDTLYSTLLGGSSGDGGYAIGVDRSGNAYVTGLTHSPDFPTHNPLQSTFGGGTCSDALERFPCQDGFVAKLTADGAALLFSTYLGGSAGDEGWALVVDPRDVVTVTGWTESADFPIINPLDGSGSVTGRDAFVTRITPDGNLGTDAQGSFSTLLGGSGDDYGRGIALDPLGNIYIAGDTTSGDFPTRNAWKGRKAGQVDTFITKVVPDISGGGEPVTVPDPAAPLPVPEALIGEPPPPFNGAFAADTFYQVWARPDLPLAEGVPGVEPRTWVWGPQPISGATLEPYAQASGGMRLVQYFDKSRMEINNPGAPRSQWQATNGLLVLEMITGQIQVGEELFVDWAPSNEVIAGDPADENPDAPRYRSFRSVAYPTNPERAPLRENVRVVTVLERDGSTHENPYLADYNVVLRGYNEELGHNIPDVFMAFFDRAGVIYDNGDYRQGQVIDWQSVLGLPISEPYWTRVRIGGTTQDVLVQAYQRRILTYTPDNPPGLRVEMGNVGQHYLRWRYGR